MNTTPTNTPTPWFYNTGEDCLIRASTADGFILTIADCSKSYTLSDSEMRANAQFIVTACNSYAANQRTIAELRESLAELLNVAELNLDDLDSATVLQIRHATELLERKK